MFEIYHNDRYIRFYKHIGALLLFIYLQVALPSVIYVNWINFNPSVDK